MQGVGGTPDTAAAFHESDLGHDIVRQVESQGRSRVAAAAAADGTDYIGSDVCGNGGCRSLEEYCIAVRRNGRSDGRCV